MASLSCIDRINSLQYATDKINHSNVHVFIRYVECNAHDTKNQC